MMYYNQMATASVIISAYHIFSIDIDCLKTCKGNKRKYEKQEINKYSGGSLV